MNTKQPKQLPDGPPSPPASMLGDLPSFADLLSEVKSLRLYTSNLSFALRDLRDYLQENFHNTYNRMDVLSQEDHTLREAIMSCASDINSISESLGIGEE